MKNTLIMVALAVSSTAFAAEGVNVERTHLGSGQPGVQGVENAIVVDNAKVQNDILHGPQYMPNFPTAATIWPRAVEVPCVKVGGALKCEGYQWSPALGRGEYLFVIPTVVEPVKPVKPVIIERIILKEVPVKPKSE